MHKQAGFTLIELLVVVLIIGVLAAIALPQYQKAVEKAIMVAGITTVRAIAQAHQLYYLEHGEYLSPVEISKLDIQIPGTINPSTKRLETQNFVYSPDAWSSGHQGAGYLAFAVRAKDGVSFYQFLIRQSDPSRIVCGTYSATSNVQRSLCQKINQRGTL